MLKYITSFFAFLFPIVRKAAIQAAADELVRAAYPAQPGSPNYYRRRMGLSPVGYTPRTRPSYGRISPDELEARYERERKIADRIKRDEKSNEEFEGTITVSFLVAGPDADNVRQWLLDNLPEVGSHGETDEIELHSVRLERDV